MADTSVAQTVEHRAICPTCESEAVHEITGRQGHTITANYDCPNRHIWSTRWPSPVERVA